MKRVAVILSSVALVAVVAAFGFVHSGFAEEGHGHGDHGVAAGKEVELEGEVVDLQCYFTHPKTSVGKDHAKCAKECIAKGLPVGFLAGGKLHLLLGPEHESANKLVADAAGKTIALTGTLLEQGGMSAIQLAKPGGKKKEGDGHSDHGGHDHGH